MRFLVIFLLSIPAFADHANDLGLLNFEARPTATIAAPIMTASVPAATQQCYVKPERLAEVPKYPFCEYKYIEDTRGTQKTEGTVVNECEPFVSAAGDNLVFRRTTKNTAKAIAKQLNDRVAFKQKKLPAMDGLIHGEIGIPNYSLVINGKENDIPLSTMVPQNFKKEYFWVDSAAFHGISSDPTKATGKTPQVLVLDISGRQAPKKTGIAKIDQDRMKWFKKKGYENEHIDYFHGKLVLKIEKDKICAVGAIRTGERRSDLLRKSQGQSYVLGNGDYGSYNRKRKMTKYRSLSAQADKIANQKLEAIIAKAPLVDCTTSTVTPEQIKEQLELSPLKHTGQPLAASLLPLIPCVEK